MPDITGPLTEPHAIETCYRSRLHCMSCDADEPVEPCYRYCFECWHVWRTPEDLLAEHNRVLAAMGLPAETDVEQVTCCPFCVHDW